MAKILIPTPLRPYTDKQDAVDAAGATVGELLADLTTRHAGLKAHLYNEQGKLRSFVNIYVNDEDIRYLQKEQTAVKADDTVSIIPSVAAGEPRAPARRSRRAAKAANRAEPRARAAGAHQRRNPALQPAPDHARSRRGGAEEAQGGQGAAASARAGSARPLALYLAAAGVGTHRHRRLRCGRLQQPAAPDPARHAGCRPARSSKSAKDRLRAINPNVKIDLYETALSSENALDIFAAYDIIIDGTDNFPTRYLVNDACVLLGKPNVVRQHLPLRGPGVGVRDRRTVRAIAACIRNRRRRAWCRAAPKAACSACCPA